MDFKENTQFSYEHPTRSRPTSNGMKLLGIDYGTKRVGIALSDDEGRLAFPSSTLPQDKNLVGKIKELCENESVSIIVIGESRDFNMKENPIMPAVRALKAALERETGLSVHLEPETLTTREARRPVGKLQMRKSRKKTQRRPVDAVAAAILLQSYIDRAGR